MQTMKSVNPHVVLWLSLWSILDESVGCSDWVCRVDGTFLGPWRYSQNREVGWELPVSVLMLGPRPQQTDWEFSCAWVLWSESWGSILFLVLSLWKTTQLFWVLVSLYSLVCIWSKKWIHTCHCHDPSCCTDCVKLSSNALTTYSLSMWVLGNSVILQENVVGTK